MTPKLLSRIKELVEAGATVLGTRPLKSPSLVDFPECDRELTRLADKLWGKDAGKDGSGENRVGKGRVIWGSTPEKILASMNVPADFSCDAFLKGQAELYAPTYRRWPGTLLRGLTKSMAWCKEHAIFARPWDGRSCGGRKPGNRNASLCMNARKMFREYPCGWNLTSRYSSCFALIGNLLTRSYP